MKNIHLIATDKPSRLALQLDCKPSYNLQLSKIAYDWTFNWQKQNIYINSDEEIKEGDWCICEYSDGGVSVNTYKDSSGINKYKIVLTTDQDLIKDGVQSIDDEFLEWFVRNPSIDEVEVSYGVLKPFQSEDKGYMIHLPDNDVLEEPKTKCYCGHTTYCDCGPEQELDMLEAPMPIYKETLEEAAEEYGISVGCDNGTAGVDFIAGAKYQQEQDKKMYSELVDLLERLATIYIDDCDLDIKYDKKRLEFIEQLKKK
jgi:hypothetical protein